MGRKDVEPVEGQDPATADSNGTLISRRGLFRRYGPPLGVMTLGGVSLGGAVWSGIRILGKSGEGSVQPAMPDAKLPAEFLSPEQRAEILQARDRGLGILRDKEGMEVRSSGELPGIPGIRFTILSHKDKIVEINTNGIAAGLEMVFAAAQAQLPSDYGQHLLRARDAIRQKRFVGTDAEIVLAYSGSPDTYPSPRGTAPEDFSAFASIPEGATFADLADREPTQGLMESGLVIMYGMNAGAIDGKAQRVVGGKRYTDLSPERVLQGMTAHELGHALLRLVGVNRDQGEEVYMRDGIEAYVLAKNADPAQPLPIRFVKA